MSTLHEGQPDGAPLIPGFDYTLERVAADINQDLSGSLITAWHYLKTSFFSAAGRDLDVHLEDGRILALCDIALPGQKPAPLTKDLSEIFVSGARLGQASVEDEAIALEISIGSRRETIIARRAVVFTFPEEES